MNLIQDFFAAIDLVFLGFATGGAAAVASAVRPVFNILVTLYVLLWGLATWRGLIREPLSDGVVRIVKIVLIGSFALNAAVYGPQIAQALYQTPDQLARVMLPAATSAATGAALDNGLQKGVSVGTKFTDAMSIFSPIEALGLLVQALLTWLFTVAIIAYATALVLLSKIALAVVLAVGPLFMAGLLFEPTRNFFSGWLAQALNSLLTYVVAVAIVALGMQFFSDSATATLTAIGGGTPMFPIIIRMLIVGVAVFVTLMQAGAIASGLAGGIQIATMGAVGWAMSRGASVLGSPVSTYRGLRHWNDRRLARDYYRTRLGLQPTLTSRSMAWAQQRVRGHNVLEKQ